MPLPISGTPEHDLYLLLKRHEDNIRQLLADNATLQSQVAALQTPSGGSYITEGDSRLSDPRDPNAHNHLLSDITDAGTAAPLDVPASGDAAAGEVVKGDDTRLTNDRDPNAHAADHASGGADQVDHDTLQNYDIAQHRVINDGGTSSIELWSADKISSEISAVVQGLDLKDSVETVADTNVTLSGEQTINGVITSASRVGVTGQSDATENGIYTTGAGAWVRTADADDNDDITQGLSFFVASGDKAGFQYVLTTADPITVGSTGLTFSEVRKLGFGTTAGTAAEGNDSRIPTQDEKDALVGTSTPNGANPFVNQADFANTQSDVSNLQSDISTAQSDISTLQSDVYTNQSDISINQSDISTLQTDKLDASDTKIPTQDEKDALVGTGTPSSSNVFVTDDDTRLDPASTNNQGIIYQADNLEIAANKAIQSDDDRVIVVCDAATTADIDIDSATPSDTYDGVTLTTFDVLLVRNQTDASENGVYIFTDTSTQLSRYVGLNTSASFAGRKRQFVVREGSTKKGVYISDEPSGFVLDTDDLEFVSIFGSAALENAGTAANEVLKMDANGNLPAVSAKNLLDLYEPIVVNLGEFLRGTTQYNAGAYKNQPLLGIDNDGTGFVRVRDGVLQLLTSKNGLQKWDHQVAVNFDRAEPDIEIRLRDGTTLSTRTGNSDRIGTNGRPMIQDLQYMDAGSFPRHKQSTPRQLI